MAYTLTTHVPLPYAEAVDAVKAALADQGFGVLTEIDIRKTFAAKLGDEAGDSVGDYVILGACNPNLASRALGAEPEMGALLPCNVVVRRAAGAEETTVEAIDPQTMVQLSSSGQVKEVADDAGTRLRAALAAVSGQ
ncbi:DUF302 domain-containing protein [Sinomonas sp. B1-1]|uniref:DUF302 domain-containing protein n=1 Tax=Sinomonas sp. B1-1 TaxID=3141454 RepID=UPI003D2E0041